MAETRVGQRTDYDRLTLTVETNGTITPEEAVSYAAALARTTSYFVGFGSHIVATTEPWWRDGWRRMVRARGAVQDADR